MSYDVISAKMKMQVKSTVMMKIKIAEADQDLPRDDRSAIDINKIRRATDEHVAVVEHQLNQHLRNGDPTKLWRTLSQVAEKGLTSFVRDERRWKAATGRGRHRTFTRNVEKDQQSVRPVESSSAEILAKSEEQSKRS